MLLGAFHTKIFFDPGAICTDSLLLSEAVCFEYKLTEELDLC